MKTTQINANTVTDIIAFAAEHPKTPEKSIMLVFGSTDTLQGPLCKHMLEHTHASIKLFCSTSGHFVNPHITDDGLSITLINFEKTELKAAQEKITSANESLDVGKRLAEVIKAPSLKHVLVFSDGLKVNGTALANGLTTVLGDQVVISGGLAGDGSRFKETLIGCNELPTSGNVVVVGLYGDALESAAASMGGWDSFGPSRKITRAEANILWELDHKPALHVYKEYLGKHAAELPASALLFPLSLNAGDGKRKVVRTILSIDEQTGAMTFAGDLPVGAEVQLMKSNIDKLVAGAEGAAQGCQLSGPPDFALLVSCVGRRLVMGQRTEEEIEAVQQAIQVQNCPLTGFYSYGELSPQGKMEKCDLHNQTMTVTMLREKL